MLRSRLLCASLSGNVRRFYNPINSRVILNPLRRTQLVEDHCHRFCTSSLLLSSDQQRDIADPSEWADNATRSIMGTFYTRLLSMATSDMNRLPIGAYPVWARRIMNEERRRRKEQGGSGEPPTKAEKKRILSIGESGSGGVQQQQQEEQKQEEQKGGTENPSKDEEQQQRQSRKGKTSTAHTPPRTHFDGKFLHDHVAKKATFGLAYAGPSKDFQSNKTDSLAIYGRFTCTTPSCDARAWTSGIVATELLFSTHTHEYRTTLFSQRCRECEAYAEPKVDVERYAYKVVDKLDLWTGNRAPRGHLADRTPEGPHDSERCHACALNKCPWSSRLSHW